MLSCSLGTMRRFGTTLLLVSTLAGCSILAPSDDEYLGGGDTGGRSSGGSSTGGTSTGGSSTGGASSGGTSTGGTSTGGSSTGGSSTGGSSTGGTSTGGTSTGGTSTGGTSTGGSSTGGTGGTSTCTPQQGTANPRAVELYLLVHRSLSLSNAQWSNLRNEISQFLNASSSAGVSVGLQYIPSAASASSCTGTGYDTPEVPFGLLPQNSTALQNSLGATTVMTGTEVEGAAHGIATLGAQRVQAKPNTQFSGVLLLTASWYGCGMSTAPIVSALSAAWPTVSTYVIGAGNTATAELDSMAAAGGTLQHLGNGAFGDVNNALEQAARPCQFELPSGNWNSVNLTLHPGGTSVGVQVPELSSASACGKNPGWYVSPSNNQTAALCPASCLTATQSSGSTLEYQTVCP